MKHLYQWDEAPSALTDRWALAMRPCGADVRRLIGEAGLSGTSRALQDEWLKDSFAVYTEEPLSSGLRLSIGGAMGRPAFRWSGVHQESASSVDRPHIRALFGGHGSEAAVEMVDLATSDNVVIGSVLFRDYLISDSSAEVLVESRPSFAEVAKEAASLVSLGFGEEFEDGMTTPFSIALETFMGWGGPRAVNEIARLHRTGTIPARILAEALRWLGQMRDFATAHARRLLLEECLDAASHYVRDGAVIGLSAMSDPRSLPALRKAAEEEAIPLLRADLQAAIKELEDLG